MHMQKSTGLFVLFCLIALVWVINGSKYGFESAMAKTNGPVVGNGTAASCTEQALATALALGGDITFNCGGAATVLFTGVKVITTSATLIGDNLITFSGGNTTRLFEIPNGVQLALRNVTVANGFTNADGGAIFVGAGGTLSAEGSTFANNATFNDASGGAIISYGTVSVTNSAFVDNAAGNGAAIYPRWGGSRTIIQNTLFRNNRAVNANSGWGGALLIWDGAQVEITNSQFIANTAHQGGAIYNTSNSALTLATSTFQSNTVTATGGALYNEGVVTSTNSVFEFNQALLAGGGIANVQVGQGQLLMTGGRISNNQVTTATIDGAGGGGYGGGINAFKAITLTDLTLNNNSAPAGGGLSCWCDALLQRVLIRNNMARTSNGGGIIHAYGTVKITDADIADNSAGQDGGGISTLTGGALNVLNATVRANAASTGGGVAMSQGAVGITNTTVSGNTASTRGGGLAATFGTNGTFSFDLLNTTVTLNRSAQGSGLFEADLVPIRLRNSIVAHNKTADGSAEAPNCSGAAGLITSLGRNLSNDSSCFLTQSTDKPNTDPNLGPLTFNGGSFVMLTHAPQPGSLAIDGANACPSTDQRGVSRPQGGACDIGAIEFDSSLLATKTPTPTPTSTATTSPTTTPTTSPSNGDPYEADDACNQAHVIASDGSVQNHTFHQANDADWIQFTVVSGTKYLIDAQTPVDSPADLVLEIYATCDTLTQTSAPGFGSGIREEITARFNGTIFLKLLNEQPNTFGTKVAYQLSVRTQSAGAGPGALIVVAGRNKLNDTLQPNIYNVTDQVYKVFQNHGYPADRITYLAPELRTAKGVTALSTLANLQQAITQWSLDKVDANHALTIYLMDHGDRDKLYLDKPRNEVLTPDLLNSWLNQLEAVRPGLKVNIFIEACLSGSFITQPSSISKAGRVIVTSSDDSNNAQASFVTGAWFSDNFLLGLDRNQSIYDAFSGAKFATDAVWRTQRPTLDDNGDSRYDSSDGAQAQKRGFDLAGTLADDNWPPYISFPATQPGANARSRVITANVQDDKNSIAQVFAAVYPPSYVAPAVSEDLVNEVDIAKAVLEPIGDNLYSGIYPDFSELGLYRIVIFAKDGLNAQARPVTLLVEVGQRIFLPMAAR